jgi:cytochrome b
MSTASASRTEAEPRRILVWDAPVRVFHWLMVASFAGAYLTAESERWRMVHVTLGYTMAGLVAFRLLWGLVGTRHARFASFVRGPSAIVRYLRSLLRGQPEHHTGHNPAGALAIVALLLLAVGVSATGWAVYSEAGGKWPEAAHEVLANLMLAVVIVHVASVALSSWLHRDNLVAAMVSGRKTGPARDGIRRTRRGVAAVIVVAVLSFWWMQWRSTPAGGMLAGHSAASSVAGERDDD